jgi:hypothetical protein
MNATLGRALAYVGLTRGAEFNRIYLATDALDPTCEQQPEDPITAQEMFAKVLAREDDNLTATETMRREQARIDDPERLRGIYDHITSLLADARGRYLLDRALPTVFYRDAETSDCFQLLLDTIAVADQHRLDSGALVADIATNNRQDFGESLAGVRDVAAVLCARADAWIAPRLTPEAVAGSLAVETWTDLNDDYASLTAFSAANHREVLAQPGRFRAVRDAAYTGPCLPVPSRHPDTDTGLADLADELRRRLTGADDAGSTVVEPEVARDDESGHEGLTRQIRMHRIARIRANHEYYIKQLTDERGRHLLYRAMPAVLFVEASRSRHFPALLDAIAYADAAGLDSNALIASIATNDHEDLGHSLLLARDPGEVLHDRAQRWITHETTSKINAAAAAGAAKIEVFAVDGTVPPSEVTATVVAVNQATETVTPPVPGVPSFLLSPSPSWYPGIDEQRVEFAGELRRRIAHEDKLLHTPVDSTGETDPLPATAESGDRPDRTSESADDDDSVRPGDAAGRDVPLRQDPVDTSPASRIRRKRMRLRQQHMINPVRRRSL